MRSLRALDNELIRHDHLFGRGRERRSLCQHLADGRDGVLLAGLGGMSRKSDIPGIHANIHDYQSQGTV